MIACAIAAAAATDRSCSPMDHLTTDAGVGSSITNAASKTTALESELNAIASRIVRTVTSNCRCLNVVVLLAAKRRRNKGNK